MTPLDLPLFATPATNRAISEARATAILIGGYDGSGNYGDIAQFDAALRLLGPLGPDLLLLPVLERNFREGHHDLLGNFREPPEHVVFFDPESFLSDDLLPIATPPNLSAATIYLYGGGYLNPDWGQRKLAMVRAAEDLLREAEVPAITRVTSGLQIDSAWISTMSVDDAALLRSFELLGGRDPRSTRAFADLDGSARVLETGDDALGAIPVVARASAASGPSADLEINVHFAEHEWVSGRPGVLREAILDFAAKLGERSGRPALIRPLIAYLDGRIDERPGVEALTADAVRREIKVAEPLVLRPSDLSTALPELRGATATIACSYHVALTSLLLGIPTVVFAENPYYEQKAAGLVSAFHLPPSFALTSGAGSDPVVDAILEGGEDLRGSIARGGEEMRSRRGQAETEVLALICGGVISQLTAGLRRTEERLRQTAPEPADLRVELATLKNEVEELRQPAMEAAVAAAEGATRRAEERAQRAEAESAATHQRLAELLGSRSWRIASPLRQAGQALRRLLARAPRD